MRIILREAEFIKKLMGWCPHAKKYETKRNINFESFDSGVPDRSRRENVDLKASGWLRRESTQILLFAIFLTFVNLLIYYQIGLDLSALLTGLLSTLLHFAFYWDQRIQRYDAISKKPIVRYVSKIKSLRGLINIFRLLFRISMAILLFLVALPYILNFDAKWMQLTFLSGLLFLTWGFYFQLIYWEMENHMKIYITFENSLEKIYAIGEKEEEF